MYDWTLKITASSFSAARRRHFLKNNRHGGGGACRCRPWPALLMIAPLIIASTWLLTAPRSSTSFTSATAGSRAGAHHSDAGHRFHRSGWRCEHSSVLLGAETCASSQTQKGMLACSPPVVHLPKPSSTNHPCLAAAPDPWSSCSGARVRLTFACLPAAALPCRSATRR